MRNRLYNLIKESVRSILLEGDDPQGTRFLAKPGTPVDKARRFFAKKYGLKIEYLYPDPKMPDCYVYFPPKKRKAKEKPAGKEFAGRQGNESYSEYLERIRQVNPAFAKTEQEIPGEEWRPIVNMGRWFKKQPDAKLGQYEVSNMGRIRYIDYTDPISSKISSGAVWNNKKGQNIELFARSDKDGATTRTSTGIHNIVADTFIGPPSDNPKTYIVIHKNGNPHDNRVENLEYRSMHDINKERYARRAANAKKEQDAVAPEETELRSESIIRNIIRESVWDVLYENTQPNQRVKAGNQQYASDKRLQDDIKKFPQYYEELVNNGKTYVSCADASFDEWLIKNHPELNYDVQICADYFERTKFFLV